MPRSLVICFDGTNNQFGPENTSVIRLVQVLDRHPDVQRLYYDGGVGTLPEPGWVTGAGKRLSEYMGLAFGAGIESKVSHAYRFLMEMWEPGDTVYVFGFSRGAYTARLLAGVLHALGLLPRGNDVLVPYVMRLYKSLRHGGEAGGQGVLSRYQSLCDAFRWTFARMSTLDDVDEKNDRRFTVHFLGLWDTVSSVGWVWDPMSYPYTATNPSIQVIRHAVSIDERRWFFRQNLVRRANAEQDLQERWFPGVHSDVGGGYPDTELWLGPFRWILESAQAAGLLLDRHRLSVVLPQPSATPWDSAQHESLAGFWWIAEVFPKMRYRSQLDARRPAIGLGRRRSIPRGATIDRWALLRLRDKPDYQPKNLAKGFVDRVRALLDVPDSIPYDE